MTRILVIDGNVAKTRAAQVAVGGSDSGNEYAVMLIRFGRNAMGMLTGVRR